MAKKVDDNGWWIIKDNPLSKVGIFPYLGKQIDDSLEPNKIYRVFRPAEELLNEETVKSFHLVPLINDHEMLGKDYEPAEEKGIDGIVSNPRPAHGDMLIGDIKIFSEKMMDDIKHGKKELSMGYTCTYDLTPGKWDGQPYDVVQRDLRGNHVALVDRGRMGSDVRVYDKHLCCDSMDVSVKKAKKIKSQDLSPETKFLRQQLNKNYVTKRKEKKLNSLIKNSGVPVSRAVEATKMYGTSTYRDRFDAEYAPIAKWLKSQELRFDNTRKKVGVKKMQEMPSYQKYVAKANEFQNILDIRKAMEKMVYGKSVSNDSWIKVPKEEQQEPNFVGKVVQKSAEIAAIVSILNLFNNRALEKEKIISKLKEQAKVKAKDKAVHKKGYDAIFSLAGKVAGRGIQATGYVLGEATRVAGNIAQKLATKSISLLGSSLRGAGTVSTKAGTAIKNNPSSNIAELALLGGGIYLYRRHKKNKQEQAQVQSVGGK